MASDLDRAYEYCRSLTKERARNFYYAFITLPPAKRRAIYAVYAFCRLCDDATDDFIEAEEKLRRVAEQRDLLAGACSGDPRGQVYVALEDAVQTFRIPAELMEDVIRGVEMDISKTRYATFEELREYCYRVASSVGLICIEIFGYNDSRAVEYAVDLGLAMQLTNILRDVEEDLERDRVYLPQDELSRFGCTEEDLFRGAVNDNFRDLMRFQVERAREYFRKGRQLMPLLSPRSRACPAVLHGTYSRILDRIEASGYNVFGRRVGLSTREKLLLMARLWANGLAARVTERS